MSLSAGSALAERGAELLLRILLKTYDSLTSTDNPGEVPREGLGAIKCGGAPAITAALSAASDLVGGPSGR